ncbi:MAG: tetratricopeptide repeat protein [Propionibacteriales bacterium]|nr:tetratricopeptide repeat protein [Propionibacteriales bacterium]
MRDGDGVRVDYFAILDLPRDAPTERIADAIKQQMRLWQKRTTNPDLSRRQEAEQRIQLLGEAREVLLDDVRRASYLDQLAVVGRSTGAEPGPAGPFPGAPPPTEPAPTQRPPTEQPSTQQPPQEGPPRQRPGGDWLQEAEDYLAAGDYASAVYAAREAKQADSQSAEGWSLLSRANAGLGNLHDAVFEARQAINLDTSNAGYCMDLGVAHERLQEWPDALYCYERAQALDPEADDPKFGIASVLMQTERAEEARPILEELHQNAEDRERVAAMLARCLVFEAERIPAVQRDGEYVVTARREITAMRRLLDPAGDLTDDPEALDDVHRMQRYLRWCERRHFKSPGVSLGCWIPLLVLVALPSLVLGMMYFIASPGIVPVLIVAVWGVLLVSRFMAWFPPGWKTNRRAHKRPGPPPVSTT